MVVHSPTDDELARSDPVDQSLDEVFDVLSNQRRRDAIACLTDSTQAFTLAGLAEEVAGRENEGPISEISKDRIRTIRTSLHHTHLPKLADAGAVECDQDRDLIWVSAPADLVERVLSFATDGRAGR